LARSPTHKPTPTTPNTLCIRQKGEAQLNSTHTGAQLQALLMVGQLGKSVALTDADVQVLMASKLEALASVFCGASIRPPSNTSTCVPVDATDGRGRTILHHASHTDNTKLMKWMLHHGANPNATDNNGFSPLAVAASTLAAAGTRATGRLVCPPLPLLLLLLLATLFPCCTSGTHGARYGCLARGVHTHAHAHNTTYSHTRTFSSSPPPPLSLSSDTVGRQPNHCRHSRCVRTSPFAQSCWVWEDSSARDVAGEG
jgi:hypothetical protein